MQELETLEAQLAEKEQLVAALTERLEQAAEQLDRLHRTGADRALRAGFMGIPPELIQKQQKLVEDLERAVLQWEEMQPGAFFGRLESQLGQIHEVVRQLDGSGEPRARPHAFQGGPGDGVDDRDEGTPISSASPQSILDRLKTEHSATADEEPAMTAGEPAVPAAPLAPLVDAPPAVDFDQAQPADLRAACMARDDYIAYLLQRMRQIEAQRHVPDDWARLENVPAELRARLEALEGRLKETLRLSEVELSVQRAKLAREESRIRTLDEQVQKEAKRVRLESEQQGDDHGDETAAAGRWRRMLGRRGNKS
jgi:hypothetical protein